MSQRYRFDTKPVAAPQATVGGGTKPYRFQILTDGLIRYEYAADCIFEDRASSFAVFREQSVPPFRVIDDELRLQIITDRFHLFYDKRPFSSSGLRVQVKGYVSNSASLWRYGYHLDEQLYALGGTVRTLDKVDGRVPLGSGVIGLNGYAEIDDSDTMLFTDNGWVVGRRPPRPAESQRVDGYLFAFGHDYKAAIKALYSVSGSQPLLPRWCLGNWWSKNARYSAESFLELMDRFKAEQAPLSVAVLDMKWHWVEEDIVRNAGASGWGGYSWNTDLFPSPQKFLSDLHERNLVVTVCDHPSEGIASYEDAYEAVCKAVGQDPSLKEVVPFDLIDQSYLNAYFDIVLKKLEDQGVDFFWQDWQQGPFSSIDGVDPLWALNHYHYLNMRSGRRRPFIFSRYAGPGSHRYPIGFSGDTIITWASLAFQPEFTATASNIGFGWWSNDIGGFMNGIRDDELAVRWVQLGVFSPILRLHSANNIWMGKEPWRYPAEARAAQSAALRLRHKLLPYLYSMNVRAARDREPLVQPVYWWYPRRAEAYWNKNTFFFGSELFIAPLTCKRSATTHRAQTSIWLPPGRHVDIGPGSAAGIVYDGDRQTLLHRRLDEYAALAREGAIIPLDGAARPPFGAALPASLQVVVVVGADGTFALHEDDGSGGALDDVALATTSLAYTQRTGTLSVQPPPQNAHVLPAARSWAFTFAALRPARDALRNIRVTVDDVAVAHEVTTAEAGLQVRVAGVATTARIAVALGTPDPQLAVNDAAALLATRLDEAQTEYRVKKIIWATVTATEFNNYGIMIGNTADHSLSRKVAELSAMGLHADLLASLLEVLTADRRCEGARFSDGGRGR